MQKSFLFLFFFRYIFTQSCQNCKQGQCSAENKCNEDQCEKDFFWFNYGCVELCEEKYKSDITKGRCINCWTDQKKYLLNNECIDGEKEGYYINNTETGLLKKCYESCKSCDKYGTDLENNCQSCIENYFKLESNCLFECPEYLYGDLETQSCINCKTRGKYLYEKKCITDKKNGTYLSNETYNILTNCHDKCGSCNGPAEEESMNCDSCKDNLVLTDKKNCVSSCPFPTVPDSENMCKKCSGETSFYYNAECRKTCPEGTVAEESPEVKMCKSSSKCKHECWKKGQCNNEDDTCKCNESFYGGICEMESSESLKEHYINTTTNRIYFNKENVFFFYFKEMKDLGITEEQIKDLFDITWEVGDINKDMVINGFNERAIKIGPNGFKLYKKPDTEDEEQEKNHLSVSLMNKVTKEVQYRAEVYFDISFLNKDSFSISLKEQKGIAMNQMFDVKIINEAISNGDYRFRLLYKNIYDEYIPVSTNYKVTKDLGNNTFPYTDSIALEITDPFSQTEFVYSSIDLSPREKDKITLNENSTPNELYSYFLEQLFYDGYFICDMNDEYFDKNLTNITNELKTSTETNKYSNTLEILQIISLFYTSISEYCYATQKERFLKLIDLIIKLVNEISHDIVLEKETVLGIYHNLDMILMSISDKDEEIINKIRQGIEKMNFYILSLTIPGEKTTIVCNYFTSVIVFPGLKQEFLKYNSQSEDQYLNQKKNCAYLYGSSLDENDCDFNDDFCLNKKDFKKLNEKIKILFPDQEIEKDSESNQEKVIANVTITDARFFIVRYKNLENVYIKEESFNRRLEEENPEQKNVFERIRSSSSTIQFKIYNKKTSEFLEDMEHFQYTLSLPLDAESEPTSMKNKVCMGITSSLTPFYCSTLFNYSTKKVICTCPSFGEVALITNKKIATEYKKIQYPVSSEKKVPILRDIFWCVTTVLLFVFGAFFVIYDYIDDNYNINSLNLTQQKYLENEFECSLITKDKGTFSLSFIMLLHSYPFFRIFNSYDTSKPKFVRFFIEIISLLIGVIISIIPYYYFPFEYKSSMIDTRDFSQGQFSTDNLPIRAHDVIIGVALACAGYLVCIVISWVINCLVGYSSIVDENWTRRRIHNEEYVMFYLQPGVFKKIQSWNIMKNRINAISFFIGLYQSYEKKRIKSRRRKNNRTLGSNISLPKTSIKRLTTLSSEGDGSAKMFIEKQNTLTIEGISDPEEYDYEKTQVKENKKLFKKGLLYQKIAKEKKLKKEIKKILQKKKNIDKVLTVDEGKLLSILKCSQYKINSLYSYTYLSSLPNSLEAEKMHQFLVNKIKVFCLIGIVIIVAALLDYIAFLLFYEIYKKYGVFIVKVWFYPLIGVLLFSAIGWFIYCIVIMSYAYNNYWEKPRNLFCFKEIIPRFVVEMIKVQIIMEKYSIMYYRFKYPEKVEIFKEEKNEEKRKSVINENTSFSKEEENIDLNLESDQNHRQSFKKKKSKRYSKFVLKSNSEAMNSNDTKQCSLISGSRERETKAKSSSSKEKK